MYIYKRNGQIKSRRNQQLQCRIFNKVDKEIHL